VERESLSWDLIAQGLQHIWNTIFECAILYKDKCSIFKTPQCLRRFADGGVWMVDLAARGRQVHHPHTTMLGTCGAEAT